MRHTRYIAVQISLREGLPKPSPVGEGGPFTVDEELVSFSTKLMAQRENSLLDRTYTSSVFCSAKSTLSHLRVRAPRGLSRTP